MRLSGRRYGPETGRKCFVKNQLRCLQIINCFFRRVSIDPSNQEPT